MSTSDMTVTVDKSARRCSSCHGLAGVLISWFDPVRHSEKYPYQNMKVSGNREKMCIAKENNFAQAGARWRSFDPARQDRFISRIAGMLTAPRVTQVCSLALHGSAVVWNPLSKPPFKPPSIVIMLQSSISL